jgi:hypothetical protein
MNLLTATRIAFAGAILSLAFSVLWFFARYNVAIGDFLASEPVQLIAIVPNATLAYFFYCVLKGSPEKTNPYRPRNFQA